MFPVNHLLYVGSWFTWNSESYFLEKTKKQKKQKKKKKKKKNQQKTIRMPLLLLLQALCLQLQKCLKTLPRASSPLTFTPLWANSADDELRILFQKKKKNGIWHSSQIASIGDNLHKMSNLLSVKNKKKNQYVVCWKFYPDC